MVKCVASDTGAPIVGVEATNPEEMAFFTANFNIQNLQQQQQAGTAAVDPAGATPAGGPGYQGGGGAAAVGLHHVSFGRKRGRPRKSFR